MPIRRSIAAAAGVLCWLAVVAAAFGALMIYSSRPGASQAPGKDSGAVIASLRKPGRALLVMVVHPRCPCTSASLDEMGDLLGRAHGLCDAVIVQYTAAGWPAPAAFQTVGGLKIPVVPDPDGQKAAKLGAETSGHCILVDAEGVVRFYGGLTLSRGHRGESPAQDAILAVLHGRPTALASAPVYGCSLTSPNSAACKP